MAAFLRKPLVTDSKTISPVSGSHPFRVDCDQT